MTISKKKLKDFLVECTDDLYDTMLEEFKSIDDTTLEINDYGKHFEFRANEWVNHRLISIEFNVDVNIT